MSAHLWCLPVGCRRESYLLTRILTWHLTFPWLKNSCTLYMFGQPCYGGRKFFTCLLDHANITKSSSLLLISSWKPSLIARFSKQNYVRFVQLHNNYGNAMSNVNILYRALVPFSMLALTLEVKCSSIRSNSSREDKPIDVSFSMFGSPKNANETNASIGADWAKLKHKCIILSQFSSTTPCTK